MSAKETKEGMLVGWICLSVVIGVLTQLYAIAKGCYWLYQHLSIVIH